MYGDDFCMLLSSDDEEDGHSTFRPPGTTQTTSEYRNTMDDMKREFRAQSRRLKEIGAQVIKADRQIKKKCREKLGEYVAGGQFTTLISTNYNHLTGQFPALYQQRHIKLVDAVEDVIYEISRLLPQKDKRFAGHYIRIGSFRDGTKTGSINEMDFLFVLDMDRESLDLVEETPVTYKVFDKAGNRIFTEDLYIDFSEAITEIISEMRLPEPLQHGGYCHPEFGGIRFNDPAVTMLFKWGEDSALISVDLSPVLPVPRAIERRIIGEVRSKMEPVLQDYRMTWFDMEDKVHLVPIFPEENVWYISTAQLEADLFHPIEAQCLFKQVVRMTKTISTMYVSGFWSDPAFSNDLLAFSDKPLVLSDDLHALSDESRAPGYANSTIQYSVLEALEIYDSLPGDKQTLIRPIVSRIMAYGHTQLTSQSGAKYKELTKSHVSLNTAAIKYFILQKLLEYKAFSKQDQHGGCEVMAFVKVVMAELAAGLAEVRHPFLSYNVKVYSIGGHAANAWYPLMCMAREQCRMVAIWFRLHTLRDSAHTCICQTELDSILDQLQEDNADDKLTNHATCNIIKVDEDMLCMTQVYEDNADDKLTNHADMIKVDEDNANYHIDSMTQVDEDNADDKLTNHADMIKVDEDNANYHISIIDSMTQVDEDNADDKLTNHADMIKVDEDNANYHIDSMTQVDEDNADDKLTNHADMIKVDEDNANYHIDSMTQVDEDNADDKLTNHADMIKVDEDNANYHIDSMTQVDEDNADDKLTNHADMIKVDEFIHMVNVTIDSLSSQQQQSVLPQRMQQLPRLTKKRKLDQKVASTVPDKQVAAPVPDKQVAAPVPDQQVAPPLPPPPICYQNVARSIIPYKQVAAPVPVRLNPHHHRTSPYGRGNPNVEKQVENTAPTTSRRNQSPNTLMASYQQLRSDMNTLSRKIRAKDPTWQEPENETSDLPDVHIDGQNIAWTPRYTHRIYKGDHDKGTSPDDQGTSPDDQGTSPDDQGMVDWFLAVERRLEQERKQHRAKMIAKYKESN